jgi:hypothetical protein
MDRTAAICLSMVKLWICWFVTLQLSPATPHLSRKLVSWSEVGTIQSTTIQWPSYFAYGHCVLCNCSLSTEYTEPREASEDMMIQANWHLDQGGID